jgi:hypothetical protein
MAEERKLRKFGLFALNGNLYKTWDADYIKLVEKDKVEIYRYNEHGGLTGLLVAVVNLDKSQNISEID